MQQDANRFGRFHYPYQSLFFGARPKRVPPAFWSSLGKQKDVLRLTGSLLTTATASACIAFFLAPAVTFDVMERIGFLVIALLIITHCVVLVFGVRRALRHFASTLQQREWRICVPCGYPLDGLPSPSRCPECGAQFSAENLEANWSEWLSVNSVQGAP